MDSRSISIGRFWWLLLLTVSAFGNTAPAAESAESILQKAIERMESRNDARQGLNYRCTKSTVTEELGSNGEVEERKEELKDYLTDGLVFRAIKPKAGNGNAPERKKVIRNAQPKKPSGKPKRGAGFINRELSERFNFKVGSQDSVEGRLCHRLSFAGKEAKGGGMEDRVMAGIRGFLWIDVEDFEVCKIDAHLHEKVNIAWGIVGSLQKFELVLQKVRLEDGFWYTKTSEGLATFRKVWSTKSVRWREETRDLRRIEPVEDSEVEPGKPGE